MISIKKYLVQEFKYSYKDAISLIVEKKVLINGKPVSMLQKVHHADRIEVNGNVLKPGERLVYYAYYKPRGIESTMNPEIPNNLCSSINLKEKVFPVGRLDKESEGLMLLTNDGIFYTKIISETDSQEKEYIVTVNRSLTDEDIHQLETGVKVLGKLTKPAKSYKINDNTFNIILTEGRNRQIRRMCHRIGCEVTRLLRVRIASVELGALKNGELRELNNEEVIRIMNLN